MIKKSYYAFLFATLSYTHLNAFSVSDLIPDYKNVDNDAVVLIEGIHIVRDLLKASAVAMASKDTKIQIQSQLYRSSYYKKSTIPGLHYVLNFLIKLINPHENLHGLQKLETIQILKMAVVRGILTWGTTVGIDKLGDAINGRVDALRSLQETIVSYIPYNPLRIVVRRLAPGMIKYILINTLTEMIAIKPLGAKDTTGSSK